jgi:hypothetical protein
MGKLNVNRQSQYQAVDQSVHEELDPGWGRVGMFTILI